MNSTHDVGGMDGFGPIVAEVDEPAFHDQWERHAFVVLLNVMCQGIANVDANRHAMESMGSVHYLSSSYYEHWLAGMEAQLVGKGIIGKDELKERVAQLKADPSSFSRPPVDPEDELAASLQEILRTGGSSLRDPDALGVFSVGQTVRTINHHPKGHTRLPRYVRAKRGRIVRRHGAHVFPDSNAHELGEAPQPLYTVEFETSELWGEVRGNRKDAVRVDLWESYLRPIDKD